MKVFLSSTYNDLIEYRKAAHDALEQLGLHVIWMEAFGARPVESTAACLEEVKEGDLFVGIYAYRYGYIPDELDISITEQEFLHAKSLGKPIFGFIVNENHPWPPKMIEHDKNDKLEAFLTKVKKQPIEFFTTPDHLANNIASSVGHYLSQRNRSFDSRSLNLSLQKAHGSTLPTQPYFFGRERELVIIADAIAPDSRTWGALIDGPGGIGKTALAIRAAHLAPEMLFERKIFITAKVREMTPEGVSPLKDFSRANYFSMLNELALELDEDRISRLAPDERANALRMALANKKTLIVFDNLETLSEDERTRLFQFLSRLPEGNKAIVTSRRRADMDARIVRLDRLSTQEALLLITEIAKNNHRLSREDEKTRRNLYEITNGNPLLIKWVCGQLGREGSAMHTITEACAFIAKAPNNNDPLEYIFGDLLDSFTESETKILGALSYFSQPVQSASIANLTKLPKQAIETALEDLTDRSILINDIGSQKFFIPSLTAQFIRKQRFEVVQYSGKLLARYSFDLIMAFGWQQFNNFPKLEYEWASILASLPQFVENTDLQIVCDALETFMEFNGHWDEFLWLLKRAEEKATVTGDKSNAGWQAYRTGYIHFLRGEPNEVLDCVTRAQKHWGNNYERGKIIILDLRAKAYELKKDFTSALRLYKKIVESQPDDQDNLDFITALNGLGNAEFQLGKYEDAKRHYQKALLIAKRIKFQEGYAYATRNLAELAKSKENWAEAEKLAREALKLAEEIGKKEEIGRDDILLSLILAKLERGSEAKIYARRGIDIYADLKISQQLKMAQDVLAKIEKGIEDQETKTSKLAKLAMKEYNWFDAEKFAREALKLAEEIGKRRLGQDNILLAQILANSERGSEARIYARRSIDIYTTLNLPEKIAEANEILVQIERGLKEQETKAYNLATEAINSENWADAERFAKEALKIAETIDMGGEEEKARDNILLAQILSQLGHSKQAKIYARNSVQIYTSLKISEKLTVAQKVMDEIELAIANKKQKSD